MQRKLELKIAKQSDLAFIQQILSKNNLAVEDIPQKLDSLFLVYLGKDRIGVGGLEICKPFGLVRSIALLEKYRTKGFGKQLIIKIIAIAKREELQEVFLFTNTADKFFEKLGFTTTDRRTAPLSIQNTEEYLFLCPSSCVCMRKYIK